MISTVPHEGQKWRKSSRSGGQTECVELAYAGAVRDSKNPGGPVLDARLGEFIAAVKAGHLDR